VGSACRSQRAHSPEDMNELAARPGEQEVLEGQGSRAAQRDGALR